MEKKDYLKRVEQLSNWAKHYYVLDNPIASDEEYDTLYRLVLNYETNNPKDIQPSSPTQKVGETVSKGFVKKKHLTRMWSQQDVFDITGLTNWYNRLIEKYGKQNFTCQAKFDGLSLNLVYDKGILQSACTRGDGIVGEDVTVNARTIKSIPLVISYKQLIEIRGEVVIHKKDFDLLNKQRAAVGKSLFANPRNAAAGSIRVLSSADVAKRKLVFYPWGLGSNSLTEPLLTDVLDFVYSLGFKKDPVSYICKDLSDIQVAFKNIQHVRNDLQVGLDGMVIKVNTIGNHDKIGYTIKHPKWACAYKFPAVEKTTTILDIINQVGRTGTITPVGILTDTLIDGSIVNRVTLHNYNEVKRKDIQIGDQVILIKSGDIIPKITKIFKDRRKVDNPTIPPSRCPICKHSLLEDNGYLRCINIECPAILKNSIVFYCSREQMNIDGVGPAVVDDLVSSKLISNVLDLYHLTYDDLIQLDGYKETKVNNILTAISSSKNNELYRLIAALGIHNVGRTVSKKLQDKFGTDMVNASRKELLTISGIGEEITNNYCSFMEENKVFINNIINIVNPVIAKKIETESVFNGKIVVLSGTMPNGKGAIKEKITSLGGVVKNAMTKNADYLITNDKSGRKYEAACKLNIPIINYDEYVKLSKKG